jgi:hypothetical protein
MEFGGVGRVDGLWFVVTGTLLAAATAVKLSRPALEVAAISRTADATVAILTVGGVDLLRDGSVEERDRVLAPVDVVAVADREEEQDTAQSAKADEEQRWTRELRKAPIFDAA